MSRATWSVALKLLPGCRSLECHWMIPGTREEFTSMHTTFGRYDTCCAQTSRSVESMSIDSTS